LIFGAFEGWHFFEIIRYLILGIIQGLTEFLPVSSSGHLAIYADIMSIQQEDLTFAILVHFATALSTIVVFRKDILDLIIGFFKPAESGGLEARKYVLLLVLSAIPAAIIGLTMKDSVEALLSTRFVGAMLIVTAVILTVSQKLNSKSENSLAPKNSILIGIAQAIAILPGISRSGSTIGAALLLGISRAEAAKFSFLMALPVILGATLLETKDLFEGGLVFNNYDTPYWGYLAGFLAAFISGVFACKLMIRLVKGTNLMWFAVYCGVIGLLAIIA
jgi:undecaprenyl-diphosphatase